jgi:hypothetical protein
VSEFTEAEISKIIIERACLKHFPWPKGEFVVDDPDSGKKAVSVGRMGEISASIRQVCDAWSKDKAGLLAKADQLSAVESATLRMLRQGTDHEQLALYGEFFYLLKLRKAGQPKRIVEVVEKIKQSDPLKIELVQQDELEDSTYFTKQTLRCMIRLIHANAAAEIYQNDPKRLLPVVAGILENWPTLESHTNMGGDPRQALLTTLGGQRQVLIGLLHLKGDYWMQMAALEEIEGLAGAALTGDSLQLYLRASGKQVLALAVSRTGRATPLTPEQASKALDAIARKEMTEDSTQFMRLFQVLPDGEGFSLSFPDGTRIGLSKDDFRTLAAGKRLPDDHALSTALKGMKEECLALYAHPLMRKLGPEMTAAKEVTFALQKAYPDMKVHRDPLSGTTSDRAKALNQKALGSLDDLLILVADKSFKVPQNATVNNISGTLTTLGVKPVVFAGEKYTGPAAPSSSSPATPVRNWPITCMPLAMQVTSKTTISFSTPASRRLPSNSWPNSLRGTGRRLPSGSRRRSAWTKCRVTCLASSKRSRKRAIKGCSGCCWTLCWRTASTPFGTCAAWTGAWLRSAESSVVCH